MRVLRYCGFLAAALLLTFVTSAPAEANHVGKSHPACPYGHGYSDGCSKADADGYFVNTDFFSYAKQSHQQSYYSDPQTTSDHPPPWNVAGVDYPVGYSSSRKLHDPATAKLPSGCAYSAAGSNKGGAIVVCTNVNNLKLSDLDFSLHNCTVLEIQSTVTGTIKISNNRFVNGSNCSTANGFLVKIDNPAKAKFKFERNFVDGQAQSYPTSLQGLVVAMVQGEMTIEYNAFLHAPARPIASNDEAALLVAYNYWEGWVYQPDDGHGEVVINYLGDNKHQSSLTYSYNTGLAPSDVCANCGTAFWYPTGGGQNTTIDTVLVDHNTSVANLNDGQATVSAASAETSYNTYGTVIFQQNYMDPTGAYGCIMSVANPTYNSAPQFVENVNMINGKTVSTFGGCP